MVFVCQIVHRDLACRNVLLNQKRVCKIADMGMSKKLNECGEYHRIKAVGYVCIDNYIWLCYRHLVKYTFFEFLNLSVICNV